MNRGTNFNVNQGLTNLWGLTIPLLLVAAATHDAISQGFTAESMGLVSAAQFPPDRSDGNSPASRVRGFVWTELKPIPGHESSIAYDINNQGQIVGSTRLSGTDSRWPCLWINGVPQIVAGAESAPGSAFGINDEGWIVGEYAYTRVDEHPALWRDGAMIDLGTLDGGDTATAFDVNNAGQIIGIGEDNHVNDQPFVWEDGVLRRLLLPKESYYAEVFEINDVGYVLGYAELEDLGTRYAGILWSPDGSHTILPTLGGVQALPRALNNAGAIAGLADDEDDRSQPVLWSADLKLSRLKRPERFSTSPRGINDVGDIVGSGPTGLGPAGPVWWRNGNLIDLTTFLSPVNPWERLSEAREVNDHLQIIASGVMNGASRGILLTPAQPRQIRRFSTQCRPGDAVVVKVRAKLPSGTFLTAMADDGRMELMQLDDRGRARLRWSNAGDLTGVCLWEYGDDACAGLSCD